MALSRWIMIGSGVIIAGIGALTFFAGGAAEYTCEEIAVEAKRISQTQPAPISEITNVQETSRTLGRDGEGRCSGQARLGDGSTADIYIRAYPQDGNMMVEYSPTAFE